ncbi:ribonuclease H-like domain-containing protein [Tanacetum coccineum]
MKYAVEILDKAHMVNCNPSQTPIETESKLGSDVQQAYIYMHDPREPHFLALKRILRYIGLTVLLLDAQLQVTVFFLATTYSLGPLSVSRRFLVPVQRRSIVV